MPAPDPWLVECGRRMRERRRVLRYLQQEVAALIGMDRSQLSGVERGQYERMRLAQLARLADVLQTTTDYLLQLTDEPRRH